VEADADIGTARHEEMANHSRMGLSKVWALAAQRCSRRPYARNVALIHFWLRQCVLPSETVQYPHRLKSTAFHLREAEGGTTVGFSGTNDMHRLLPLHMKQLPIPDLQLEATNGLMLDMLVK
jgi:hypothetical protein